MAGSNQYNISGANMIALKFLPHSLSPNISLHHKIGLATLEGT